jgi:serine/threonine-protein phosphatase 5
MIIWFKDGNKIPTRYVWEIVLRAYEHFVQEETLVNLNVEEGMTCDVIGSCSLSFLNFGC